MTLAFTKRTPIGDFRRLEQDLKMVGTDLTKFKAMSPRQIEHAIRSLKNHEKQVIRESSYGSWLNSGAFATNKMLGEALHILKEYKEEKQEGEVLIPGFVYYRGVKQFGNMLEGKRVFFSEGGEFSIANWKCKSSVAKALEFLSHGNEEQFKKIYVEMADGRSDALGSISVEHITESSEAALEAIELYCDKNWAGPWAWDLPFPYKLRDLIEDNLKMRISKIEEMQGRFNQLISQLNEGDMDQFEVVMAAKEMTKKIQSMIEDLGKISGEGLLTLKDNTRSAYGDDAASQLDQIQQPLNQAADTLSQLRAHMESAVEQLEGGANTGAAIAGAEMGGQPGEYDDGGDGMGMGDELGSPADALGGDPMGDAAVDELADVNMDGEGEERPKKEI